MNPQDQSYSLPQSPGQEDDDSNSSSNNQNSTNIPTGQTLPLANKMAASSSQPTTQIPLPNEAEDTDLIEKEWVERAKQIVEHTRDDPYEQQRALSQMKADYLKKRYNKDVKAPEG